MSLIACTGLVSCNYSITCLVGRHCTCDIHTYMGVRFFILDLLHIYSYIHFLVCCLKKSVAGLGFITVMKGLPSQIIWQSPPVNLVTKLKQRIKFVYKSYEIKTYWTKKLSTWLRFVHNLVMYALMVICIQSTRLLMNRIHSVL